jgi:hypothetical protein
MASNIWVGDLWREAGFAFPPHVPPPRFWNADQNRFEFIGNGVGEEAFMEFVGPQGDIPATIQMPYEIITPPVNPSVSILAEFMDGTSTVFASINLSELGAIGTASAAYPDGASGLRMRIVTSDGFSAYLYDGEVYVGARKAQEVFVYTMNRVGQVGAWSRYVFPFTIDATALLGERLYLRAGDNVYVMDENADTDAGTPIEGIVQWPWLDFGQPGNTKMMQAVDVVGTGDGNATLQVGYDQRDPLAFTPDYTLPIDTMTGMPVPMPVSAPTFSIRLKFTGKWSLQAVNVYIADNRRTT